MSHTAKHCHLRRGILPGLAPGHCRPVQGPCPGIPVDPWLNSGAGRCGRAADPAPPPRIVAACRRCSSARRLGIRSAAAVAKPIPRHCSSPDFQTGRRPPVRFILHHFAWRCPNPASRSRHGGKSPILESMRLPAAPARSQAGRLTCAPTHSSDPQLSIFPVADGVEVAIGHGSTRRGKPSGSPPTGAARLPRPAASRGPASPTHGWELPTNHLAIVVHRRP